jgi:hypothetical protein
MKTFLLSIVLLLLLGTLGCKKWFSDNYTFTLKGTAVRDCSGTPFAFDSVILCRRQNGWGSPSQSFTTITDANGNFTFSGLSQTYTAQFDLSYREAGNGTRLISGYRPSLNGNDGQVVDLGKVYHTYVVQTIFKLDIDQARFNAADTLYIGYEQHHPLILFPIPSSTIVALSHTNYDQYPLVIEDSILVGWSTHRSHYDSIVASYQPADAEQHKFFSKAAFCGYPDTGYYVIP